MFKSLLTALASHRLRAGFAVVLEATASSGRDASNGIEAARSSGPEISSLIAKLWKEVALDVAQVFHAAPLVKYAKHKVISTIADGVAINLAARLHAKGKASNRFTTQTLSK
jgi:hypothetical protein